MSLPSVIILFVLLLPLVSRASHFDGGTITYKVINSTGSSVFILISQTYIYVYPTIYWREDGKSLNCTSNCTTSGGYIPVPLNTYCTDYSSTLGITIGERSDVVNVSSGSYFVVTFSSNNWRPLTLPYYSASQAWNIACVIDLRLRQDGTFNHPPVATIISPIYIPVGIQQNIFIPTIDADNDQVRCRFANGSGECANVCPPASLPNGTMLFSNCTLLITGITVADWYAVAIMIEDFINSSSTTPLSAVPIQFLINVQSKASCSTRPLLTGPISQSGVCVGVQVGQPYSIQLVAENFCSNTTTITDIATLSFPIVIKTPIVRNNVTQTLWSVSLTWIPTAMQVGSQVLCAVAIDSVNVQSNQYCITFTVAQGGIPACPGQPEVTTIPSTTVAPTSTRYITSVAPTTAVGTSTATTTAVLTSTATKTAVVTSTATKTTTAVATSTALTTAVGTSTATTTAAVASTATKTTTAVATSTATTTAVGTSAAITTTGVTSTATTTGVLTSTTITTAGMTSTAATTAGVASIVTSTQSITNTAPTCTPQVTTSTVMTTTVTTTATGMTTTSTTTATTMTTTPVTTTTDMLTILPTTATDITTTPAVTVTDMTTTTSTTIATDMATTPTATATDIMTTSTTTATDMMTTSTTTATDMTTAPTVTVTDMTTTSTTTATDIMTTSSTTATDIMTTSTTTATDITTIPTVTVTDMTITLTTTATDIMTTSSTTATDMTTTPTVTVTDTTTTSATTTTVMTTTSTITATDMPTASMTSATTRTISASSIITAVHTESSTTTDKTSTSSLTTATAMISLVQWTDSTTSSTSASSVDTTSWTDSIKDSFSTSSSSVSTIPWSWLAPLLAIVASLLIVACICCCCCYPAWYPCCFRKRRRKRSSTDEIPAEDSHILPPIPTNTTFTSDLDSNADSACNTRPASAVSSRNVDSIQLTVLPSPRKKPMPHYTNPLQRSPKIAPLPTSSSPTSVWSNASPTSLTPEAYIFGSQYASKINK